MSSSSAVSQAHLDTLSTAKTQLLAAVAEKFQNVERALSAIDADRTERHQQMKTDEANAKERMKEMTNAATKETQKLGDAIAREREALDDEKKTMETVQEFQSSRVKLNIGGQLFTTSLSTLVSSRPDSMLAAMFSGRHKISTDEDGYYFIDRDGHHFRHILNYLRNGTIKVSLESDIAIEVAIEAEYYGLHELAAVLRSNKIDIQQYLGEEISKMRDNERMLREPLSVPKSSGKEAKDPVDAADAADAVDDALNEMFPTNPHIGLISIFEDDGALASMNQSHTEDPMGFSQILQRYGKLESEKMKLPTTVPNLMTFRRHFEHQTFGFEFLTRLAPILNEKKILIAGGSVLRALTGSNSTENFQTRRGHLLGKKGDIDIFVCTQDEVEATTIAGRIVHLITENRSDFRVVRGSGVINIDFEPEDGEINWDIFENGAEMRGNLTVQIVLRLYESPAEVLLGFDCDCCCVGFDGDRVWGLPRALRAIQYGTNILNPLHAWPSKASYEFRLVKYALRGYSISVPGLEAVDVDLTKIFELPLSQLKGFARLVRLAMAYEGFQPKAGDILPPCTMSKWTSEIEKSTNPARRELGVVLKETLGECEYARLVGEAWFYCNDGFMSKLPPKSLIKDLAIGEGDNAWEIILDCSAQSTKGIPAKLQDAWDCAKRSREYLNAKDTDLDARYFAHAAHDHGLKKGKKR